MSSESAADGGNARIRRIAIVGGGTAGWMSAAILARALTGSGCSITVVESPDIGTVGVGEATIPPIIDLLQFLSIDADDFVRHTQATFKLGIKFTDWRSAGHSYWHPFGTYGETIQQRPFHHVWNRARELGLPLNFNDYSLCATLGDAGRFRVAEPGAGGAVEGLRHALHFDASLVAAYLRAYCEKLDVLCLPRTVSTATQREDGFLDELVFSDGTRLAADLFIDCSGFRALLIEQVLKTGYVDWSSYLPCDRAVAVQTELSMPRPPYTQSTACAAGWRWRIPLQHRVGNGSVYCSEHLDDAQALNELVASLNEKMITVPRVQRFTAGRRTVFWNRNCVAIGLASGFLEPLESTSIHLIMSAMYKLLEFFPDRSFARRGIDSYNAESIAEMERIRDFIVLHYCLTDRQETAFWRYCRSMPIPDSLAERIAIYRQTGRIRPASGELFSDLSWFYIFEGMGLRPQRTDPLLDFIPADRLRDILAQLAQSVNRASAAAPSHDSFFADGAARFRRPAGIGIRAVTSS